MTAYWTAQGMPWRTVPEISEERRQYLAERRATKSDTTKGIYPFRDENGRIKLDRADVEWLLATHESNGMTGPVDAADEAQKDRDGLDLRGANLQRADLSRLPLNRLNGGQPDVYDDDGPYAPLEQSEAALIQLDGANLALAQLCGANLNGANLRGANLYKANLQASSLQNAMLDGAKLEGATIRSADFFGASLVQTQ